MKLLLLITFAALSAFGQGTYQYSRASTLSSSTEKITIQQPSSSARRVKVKALVVYCSASCTLTFSRDGTAATATAGTAVALSSDYASPTVTAWRSSNAGSGTTLGTSVLPAGATVSFSTSGWEMNGASTARNYSCAVASMTGDVIITFVWTEE